MVLLAIVSQVYGERQKENAEQLCGKEKNVSVSQTMDKAGAIEEMTAVKEISTTKRKPCTLKWPTEKCNLRVRFHPSKAPCCENEGLALGRVLSGVY